jgi:prolyl-tRNA synthetase
VLLDTKAIKASNKRWAWVKKGAPIIVEVGPRDVQNESVSFLRRNELYITQEHVDMAFAGDPPDVVISLGKPNFVRSLRTTFPQTAVRELEGIQRALYTEAKARLDENIARDVTDLALHYAGDDKVIGWVEVQWARPTGDALEAIVQQLKALKLTVRNVPVDAAPVDGACFFTGEKGVERILIGRTY